MSMTGAGVQALIAQGLGVAAASVGVPYTQYRPAGASLDDPIVAANQIGTINALFTQAAGMAPKKWAAQAKPDTPFWYFIANLANINVGDYLVGDYTYGIVIMQTLMMPMALRCPDTVSIQRGVSAFTTGEGYSQTLTTLYSSLPASISVKRDKGFSKPPGFPAATETPTPLPMFDITVVPAIPDGAILAGDMITDQNGQQYRVDAAIWRPSGYYLNCGPYIATA
jgi:hypothetical protein